MSNSHKPIHERKHRLDHTLYTGHVAVCYTACIQHHKPLFQGAMAVHEFTKILFDECKKHHCEIPAYIFMPDHAHIIIQGTDDYADTLKAMTIFKQRTGFWLYQHRHDAEWQKDFYDHIIRGPENLQQQICYVLNNPVRKESVADWREFKFKGSSIYNFDEW